MPWNATAPLGSVSVKANRTILQQNTSYIETTMGDSVVGTNFNTTRDHFWNVGANEDGRHRFVQSIGFTEGGLAANPLIGAGMDGVTYLRSDNLTAARIQGFYRNSQGIYQYIPAYISGTAGPIPSSGFVTLTAVPNNSYGEIFMYLTDNSNGSASGQTGFFKATNSKVDAWAINYQIEGSGTAHNALKFGNGSDASGLNILVRRSDASGSQVNWTYKITYRAL